MSIEKIDQKNFFDLLNEEGYTTPIIFDLLESGIADSSDVTQFNLTLQKIYKEKGIKMFDMIVYLEGFYTDYKKITSLLDEKSNKILLDEIEATYYIKKKKSGFEELQ